MYNERFVLPIPFSIKLTNNFIWIFYTVTNAKIQTWFLETVSCYA